jgi:hypothetical protein
VEVVEIWRSWRSGGLEIVEVWRPGDVEVVEAWRRGLEVGRVCRYSVWRVGGCAGMQAWMSARGRMHRHIIYGGAVKKTM